MHPLLKELENEKELHGHAPDVVPAAHAESDFATLAPDVTIHTLEPQIHDESFEPASSAVPPLDTTFRATDVRPKPPEHGQPGGWARRLVVGVLLAVCGAAYATDWQPYAESAKRMIATVTAPFFASAPPQQVNPQPAQQAEAPTVRPAVTAAAPEPAAPAVQPVVESNVAAQGASDPLQAMQTMTREIATMGQQIEQLKASIAQLKASQEQMSREVARASEAKATEPSATEVRPSEVRPSEVRATEPHPRAPIAAPKMAAPLRPVAAPAHKPRPALSSAQYAPPPLPPITAPAVAAPPPQATVQPNGEPVVRPPLPVR